MLGHHIMPRRAKIFLICLLLSAAVLFSPSVRYGYNMSDTLNCLLTTGQNTTRFAPGYTERAFSKIHQGMTADEVFRILGEPLNRVTWSLWPEGDWDYSQPATSSGHYHCRFVRFARDGRVSGAGKSFYFD